MELIPGVQEGGRLTLHSVDARLSTVETVLAKLADDFYEPVAIPDPQPEANNKPFLIDYALELKDARIAELEDTVRTQEVQITNLSADLDDFVRDNDILVEQNGALLEERDNLAMQLNNIRAAML